MFGKKKKNKGCISVSATIGVELHQKAQEMGLGWSDSLRKGVALSLQEKEWNCNIWEKLRILTEKLSIFAQKNHELLQYNSKILAENTDLKLKIRGFQEKLGELRLK